MKAGKAQAVLEFTTASIVFIMLAFGLVQILRWAPHALSEKAEQHDACMENSDVSVACMKGMAVRSLNAQMP